MGKPKRPLNNALRLDIRRAVVAHRFDKLESDIKKRTAKLADKFYREFTTPAQRKFIEAAPDGWFQERPYAAFQFLGETQSVHFDKPRRIPESWTRYSGNNVKVSSKEGFGAEYQALREEERKTGEERAKASLTVGETLQQFRFVEDLIAAWPEIKRFIPKPIVNQVTALALPPQQLNEMLGL